MHIRKIKSGGVNNIGLNDFVGEIGTLFYDPVTRILRISDGHTPGGNSIFLEGVNGGGGGNGSLIQSEVAPIPATTTTLWYDTVSGRSYVYFDNSWVDSSPESNSFTATDVSYFNNDVGYLTSGTVNQYVTGGTSTGWELTSSTAVVSLSADGNLTLPSGTTVGVLENSVSGFLASWSLGEPFEWFIEGTWHSLKYLTTGTQLQITYPTGPSTTYTETFTLASDITVHSDDTTFFFTTTAPSQGLYGGTTTVAWSYPNPSVGIIVPASTDFMVKNDNYQWTFSDTGQFNLGTAQNRAGTFTDVAIQIDSDVDSYAQFIFQNHNNGATASTDIVLMNSGGDDISNIIDLGINSNNFSWGEYSINSPGSGYLFTNGGDLTIGTQTPGKALIFHAGGTTSTNSVGRFDQYGWTFNRQVVVSDHKDGPLVFTNQNTSDSSGASATYQGQNDDNSYFQLGILGSHNGGSGPKWGPSDVFLTANGSGNTLHIGGQTHLNFYADYHNSNTGIPALAIDRDDQSSTFNGNVLPLVDSEYNIGSSTSTWNTLYVNNVSYAPTTPSDWSGTPPTTIQQAIDRLASAVKALNGTGA